MRPCLLVWLLLGIGCDHQPVTRHEPDWKSSDSDADDPGPDDTRDPETGSHHPDSGDTDSGDTGFEVLGPARYPTDQLQSPIPASLRDRLSSLHALSDELDERVFMKVGDSITADPQALGCFAGSSVDLGEREDLEHTLEFFLAGEAGSGTPFDRDSRAAEIGETAAWALEGDPSPLEREQDALSPSFAVVQYGTNDMEMGTTHLSAIWSYGEAMLDLADRLLAWGVVPIIVAIPPRGDDPEADTWVPIYNAVARGIAQARQFPFVNLELGLRLLDDLGLGSDGVHLEYGGEGPCDLAERGLRHGGNTRNLLVLDALDRVRRATLEGEALDAATAPLDGLGSASVPFVIDGLPFTDLRHTGSEGVRGMDRYDGCGSSADESGPELVYRLDLERPARLLAMVFDRGEVDIDLHLLGERVEGSACVERDDSDITVALDAGTWFFVLDTYVSDGVELSGEYLFVLVER